METLEVHICNRKREKKMSRLKMLSIVFICLGFARNTSGQVGAISGKVTDGDNGEEIIAATVLVKGGEGMYTLYDGTFLLQNIKVGQQTLIVSYIGYTSQEITVMVKANETVNLNIKLKAETTMLSTLEIKSEKIKNTEQAVVFEIRNAQQVVSGLSKEQIAKSQDNNAAQVIQRIPGVTVVDNRFVMIRGLSERYNNVMINNVIAPNTEVDKRTFSFDLIGSGALDRMLIFKTGAADMPGDFAGGVIKLFTIEELPKSYVKLNFGYGHRVGTTFNPYMQSEGSKTDMLGFDNGYRTLPSTFPSTFDIQDSRRDAQIRQDAAHRLPNNFVAFESMATPDFSLGMDFGQKFNIKKVEVTAINHFNYSQSYQFYQREFNRYFEWVDRSEPILQRFAFTDNTYQQDVKFNVLSNWVFKFNDKHKIKFKNLFNQIGENETVIRNGKDFIQRPNDALRNYLLGYKSRTIYTGQLEGTHVVKDNQVLNWVAGLSFLNESEPDLRRFRTFRPNNSTEDEGFQMQLPPSSNLFETGRYFGNLQELSVSHGLDYAIKLDDKKEGKKINMGYYTDYRNRSFSSRYFSYLYPGFNDPAEGERLRRLPLDEVFSNNSIRTRDGFIIEEGTRPIDSYTASNFLNAGYVNFSYPVGRTKVAGGVRAEHNIQKMNSRDDFSEIEVNNPILSMLPFANFNYINSPKSLFRLGYSRTINRPEFREIAPFLFYDYKYEAGRVGNPNLKTATIDNFDFRYEYYPRGGETVSVGAFYKNFTNPIENRTIVTTEQPTFSYINADKAFNYGVELELRKSLLGVTNYAFLNKLSVNVNFSYIISQVDLGETAVAQARVRALQGQSPYIFNSAISYNDEKNKLAVTAVYNIFGDRIFSVGDVIFPTIYELSRHSFDLTINKKVGERLTFKIGAQDLLNFPFRFFEDSDRNEKITSDDNPIVVYRRGSIVSFSMSYDLSRSQNK